MVVHLCHCNLKSGEALRSCPGYCGTVAPRHHAKVGEGGVVDQAIILGENLLLRLFSKNHLLSNDGEVFQVHSSVPRLSCPEFSAEVHSIG